MRPGRWAGCVALALLCPSSVWAQEAPGLTSFVQELETAGRRFTDVRVAIAEGYRKLGPDFPGMGEHWVNPGLVIAGALDPERPPVIGYAVVEGERRLISFAYTKVLGPDETPPPGPFPSEAWHDHTGGVDEESLLLSGPMSMHGQDGGFRLSMVHVWLGAENPDGVLAQNNWALPFLRVGAGGETRSSSEAGRALSLATEEGVAFYDQLLREGVGLEGSELELAISAFQEAARSARMRRDDLGLAGTVAPADVDALEEIWHALWARLGRTMSEKSLRAMAVLRS